MSDTIKIKIAEGRRVRDPDTGAPIGSDAVTVTRSIFWQRRLDDGDVVLQGKEKA